MQHSRSGLYVDGHVLQASSVFTFLGDLEGFSSSFVGSIVVDKVSSAVVLETSASVASAVVASSVDSSTVTGSSASCAIVCKNEFFD